MGQSLTGRGGRNEIWLLHLDRNVGLKAHAQVEDEMARLTAKVAPSFAQSAGLESGSGFLSGFSATADQTEASERRTQQRQRRGFRHCRGRCGKGPRRCLG
jgi:hypothetical protein